MSWSEVRLTEDDLAALERVAEEERRTVEEVLHTAVREYTSGWRRRRDDLLDDILRADAGLLRKLGAS